MAEKPEKSVKNMLAKLQNFGKSHPAVSVFLVSFFLFSLGAIGTEINKLDVRFALFLKDFEWNSIGVFPKLNGWDYPDYFIPWTLLSMVTTLGGRFINLWTMALPTIIAGSAMIALTYRMGEEIRPRMGLYSAGLLFTVSELYFCVCGFGLDVPVALFGILMLYRLQKTPGKIQTHLLFAVLVILSILIRGSLGLLVFGAASAGWLLGGRRWKQVLTYGITGGIAATLGIGLVLGLILLQGGQPLLDWAVNWQISKRVAGGDYLFYVIDGFLSFAPLTFFALIGMITAWKKLREPPFAEWLGFILLPVLILSIPGGKHMRYMLFTLPPFALFGGWGLMELTGKLPESWRKTGGKIFRILPIAGMIAVLVITIISFLLFPKEIIPFVPYAAGLFLFFLLFLCRTKFSGQGIFVLVMLCAALVFATIVLPFNGLRENNSLFAIKTEAERKGTLWFFNMGPDHEDLKYWIYVPGKARKTIRYLSMGKPRSGDPYNRMFEQCFIDDTLSKLRPEDRIIVKGRNNLNLLAEKAEKAGFTAVIDQRGRLGHASVMLIRLEKRNTVPAVTN